MSTAAPIRWGLLGTARINAKLLAGAAASESARVVAVGSRSADVARAFAAANGIERAHGSYEDLLADDGVDAVYISLPNALHHRWTMIALAAGKHVLCEKPYSRHPEDVDVAWDAAEAGGLVLQEALHVAPHAAGRSTSRAAAADRRARGGARHVQLPPRGRGGYPRR